MQRTIRGRVQSGDGSVIDLKCFISVPKAHRNSSLFTKKDGVIPRLFCTAFRRVLFHNFPLKLNRL